MGLRNHLQNLEHKANIAIQEFATSLNEAPFLAFKWADRAVQAAAEKQIAYELLSAIRLDAEKGLPEDQTFARLKEHIIGQAIDYARNPARSTSFMTEIMDKAFAAAWGDLANAFRYEDKL